MRALAELPRLDIRDSEARRIARRARASLKSGVERRRRVVRLALGVARPLVPLSLAGFALSYLFAALRQVFTFHP
jgi:hypothetical protein